MLRLVFVFAIAIGACSCGEGKHEPEVKKDSVAGSSNITPGTGTGSADSTNGAAVRPIDTASSQRRNPGH